MENEKNVINLDDISSEDLGLLLGEACDERERVQSNIRKIKLTLEKRKAKNGDRPRPTGDP